MSIWRTGGDQRRYLLLCIATWLFEEAVASEESPEGVVGDGDDLPCEASGDVLAFSGVGARDVGDLLRQAGSQRDVDAE